MQFGDLFVDIEVDGKSLSKEIIDPFTGMDCFLIETAGASLPYAYVRFVALDEKIMNLIQLGNNIKLIIGNDGTNKDTFIIDILPPQQNKDSSDTGWIVEFAGFLGNKSFMINHKNKAYKGNSLMVAKQILEEMGNINIINDFSIVKEEQVTWMRTNKTANTFLAEVLMHANIQPSFPLFTFDKYLNFYIKDIYKSVKEGYKYKFTSKPVTGNNKETNKDVKVIQYYNNFNPKSYKHSYNMFSGYNKISEIQDIKTGMVRISVDTNDVTLASSSIAEADWNNLMNIISINDLQSGNVHKAYNEAYINNANKLLALSSIQGILELNGKYYRDLKPLDLVYVEPNDVKDTAYLGNYLIDTIVTRLSFNMGGTNTGGVKTYVYVTRDNKNNVENYSVIEKYISSPITKGINIFKERRNSLLSYCSALKSAYSLALKFFDGEYLRKILRYAILVKNGVLQAFSIDKIIQDMTSPINFLRTLIMGGNSLMNTLIHMIFPQDVYTVLKDFLVNENTSLEKIVRNYIFTYTPTDILDVVLLLYDALAGTTNGLKDIARDNGIIINKSGGYIEVPIDNTTSPLINTPSPIQDKISNIINDFENNTIGLNIPFPIITPTESEQLYSDTQLRDYVANKVIENLNSLEYLENVDMQQLKDTLLGKVELDFELINQINKNVGETLLYRFWGTYKDLLELTSFKIKKSFKDKYKTIPCTKVISALDNTKIFFCCPKDEEVKFYINSKFTNLQSFELNLGYVDAYKVPIVYNVYYTEEAYNSSSVLLEVRQKVVL